MSIIDQITEIVASLMEQDQQEVLNYALFLKQLGNVDRGFVDSTLEALRLGQEAFSGEAERCQIQDEGVIVEMVKVFRQQRLAERNERHE